MRNTRHGSGATESALQESTTTYHHWKVEQRMPSGGGTTNWFTSKTQARSFADSISGAVSIIGETCEDYEAIWPEDYRQTHWHVEESGG